MLLNGLEVRPSAFAVQTKWQVERWPIRKRRRKWHVVSRTVPCAFVVDHLFVGLGIGKVLYVHPDTYAELKTQYGHVEA